MIRYILLSTDNIGRYKLNATRTTGSKHENFQLNLFGNNFLFVFLKTL